ncbi:2'-5' RNA ligase family protein [uncultured Roseobacter sp.]|uniref:2'-5' RNA ligase family protein n=1 Tax=uncultured Roseobacter sp. TaxID=114847 RepID=UPI00261E9059|nr:2'-5' RNA ligase family protein [uncultured Roseobacter sp.]
MINEPGPEHSVWLLPEAQVLAALQEEIRALSAGGDQPVFCPHVTVAGDLAGRPENTARICRALFADTGPVAVRVTDAEVGETFFMSLFLRLEVPGLLRARHSDLYAELKKPSVDPWQPHISLAYGMAADDRRAQTRARLAGAFKGARFHLTDLVVARSPSTLPIASWSGLNRIRL